MAAQKMHSHFFLDVENFVVVLPPPLSTIFCTLLDYRSYNQLNVLIEFHLLYGRGASTLYS
jgi:hypothetical protein